MKTAELITELTEKYGVSGHESAVSDFAVEIISKYCDETNIDNMGNVIGKITGTSSENEEKQKSREVSGNERFQITAQASCSL